MRMLRFIILLLFFANSGDTFSQDSSQSKANYNKFEYGLSINFNAPVVFHNATGFSSNGGYGAGMFTSMRLNNSQLRYNLGLQFNVYTYTSSEISQKFDVLNYEMLTGVKFLLPKMDQLRMNLNIVPAYADVHGSTNFTRKLNQRFDLGYNLGFELEMAKGVNLELGYFGRTLRKRYVDMFDAQPDAIRLSLNITFNKAFTSNSEWDIVAENLESLRAGKLYIVNKACTPKFTNEILDSLFRIYYTYSSYEVIGADEAKDIIANKKATFFAIVGEYYAGLDEPLTTGIYLLDSSFQPLYFPYPIYTSYTDTSYGSKCFDNMDESIRTIQDFVRRLENRSGSY